MVSDAMNSDGNAINDAPVCDICGKRFSTNGNLLRHKRRIHEIQVGRQDAEKKVTCDVCQSKFTRKTYLKEHIKKRHSFMVEIDKNENRINSDKKQSRVSKNQENFLPLLPKEYAYKTEFASEEKFKISFPASSDDPHGEKWLCSFEDLNGVEFRVASTRRNPKINSNVRWKKNFRCMHGTRPGKKVKQILSQNLNCPVIASMIVTTSKESIDKIVFYQNHLHNHTKNCALSRKYKRVQRKIIREKFHHIASNSSSPLPPSPTVIENVVIPHPVTSEPELLPQEMISDEMHRFQADFVEDLLKRAGQSVRIRDALSALVKNYKNCATEESIVLACSTFGKFTGSLKKKKLTSTRKIRVSATKVASGSSSPAA